MTNPIDPTDKPDDLQQAIARLPRERPARAHLEDVVVRALRVAGELSEGRPVARPRTRGRLAALAIGAAAALAIALLRPWSQGPPAATPGASYMLLLYEDSAYRAAGPGHERERVAEYQACGLDTPVIAIVPPPGGNVPDLVRQLGQPA